MLVVGAEHERLPPQRAKVEAALLDSDDDVRGHQYIGQFNMTSPAVVYSGRTPVYGQSWRIGWWFPDTTYYPPLH